MLKLNSSSSITWRKVDYHFWVMKMCMGTWKWHCIEIILTFQSSKDWPLSTEINPTSSPYYLLSDLKVSLQNKQRLLASCYFPYDSIISQRDKTKLSPKILWCWWSPSTTVSNGLVLCCTLITGWVIMLDPALPLCISYKMTFVYFKIKIKELYLHNLLDWISL